MRQSLSRQGVFILALFGMMSASVYGANVGYYEMCDGEGQAWQVPPISVAGHTPVYLSDLSTADLAGLDALFVTNCANLSYGEEYLSRLPEIDAAVQNGLSLIVHDRRVSHAAGILPGGSSINYVRAGGSSIDVADDTTLVTNGPGGVLDNTSMDDGRYSNHGYALTGSLPAGNAVILTQANPTEAVAFSYPYGNGSVIFSTIPVDAFIRMAPLCYMYSTTNPTRRVCINVVNTFTPNVVAYAVALKNSTPVAQAGVDQSVDEGMAVVLDASASRGHGALTYQWQQLSPASPLIQLSGATGAKPSFTAPTVSMNTTFTLQLVVTDVRGTVSAPDTVDITVKNLNTPPVADAGNNFAIKAGATASLDGSHSYDADGDTPLTYSWSQLSGPAVTLQDPAGIQPGFVVPNAIGQELVFELIVNDGQEPSPAGSVTVSIVDNAPPLADAGVDQTRDEGNIVVLNALASSDSDKDGLMFDWLQIAGPMVTLDNPGSPTPFFTAPKVVAGGAAMTFTLTVTDTDDLHPKSSVAQVVINVRNINDAPACNLARPSVAGLWPPNHKLRQVRIDGVSDVDSLYKDVSIVINSVTMDEPVVGHGSGHSSPDAVVQAMQPTDRVLLRAERKQHSNGRVYQVNFTADDGFESCTGSIKVSVPKSRRHHGCHDEDNHHGKHKARKHEHDNQCQGQAAVDDGQKFDATEEVKHHDHNKGHDEKDDKKDHHDKDKGSKNKKDHHNKNKKHNNKNNR